MQENENTVEKYIRKDDSELDESINYINYLVDAYKQTDDIVYRDALLDAFDSYFLKYVSILHGKGEGVNPNNNDTKNFLRLFMKKEDRINQKVYIEKVGSYIHMIRRAALGFTKEDLYHDIITYFLELLNRYSPVTYKRNEDVHRISFVHYVQVGLRYKLCKGVVTRGRDILTGKEWVEFDDTFHDGVDPVQERFEDIGVGIDLLDWVWGSSSKEPFSSLTEMERYLLWLRFESDPDGKKISTREISEITGHHERTIIYKLKNIKKKLRPSLEAI